MPLYLIRHGQDTDNEQGVLNGHRDTELTKLGQEQARQAAEKLRESGRPIDLIYSSPLRRTTETAEIIANHIKVKVAFDQRLKERDFGLLTGRPLVDIPKYATRVLETDQVTYFLEAEGVESFPDLLKRAKSFLRDIQDRHSGQNLVIVTHGDTGKMLRAVYYGWSVEDGLKTPHFSNADIIEL